MKCIGINQFVLFSYLTQTVMAEGTDEKIDEKKREIITLGGELEAETRSEPHKDKYVIVPPHWPNELWETKPEHEVNDKQLRSGENIHPNIPTIDHQANSGLARFLKVFDDDLKVLEQDKSKEIKDDMTAMVNGTVQRLKETQPIFQMCRLIPAGSVAEGTKIGEMNEFDYLLILDIFRNEELFEVHLHQRFTVIFMKNVKEKDMFLASYPTMFELQDSTKVCITDMRSVLMGIFMDDFLANMLPGWTFWSPEEKVCVSDVAATLHLTSKKHEMDVDVDICLCIPVSKDSCTRATKRPTIDDSVTFFAFLELLDRSINEDQDCRAYAIIGESVPLFSLPTTASRITIPMLESAPLGPLTVGNGRFQTYRFAKCLASVFLPKRSKMFGCDRCCHSLVKSYDLKNIVLFMIKNNPDDANWAMDKVCCRLVEVFQILTTCIPEKDADAVATISTCCLPGILRIDEISTYNPFIETRGEKTDLLFTPDSHKPMYGLRSPPEYKQYLHTGVSDIDTVLKEYFEHLHSDHWDTYDLIQRITKLLTMLHSMTPEPEKTPD